MKKQIGPICIFMSAVLFSLGGVLIDKIPWQPMSINGFRTLISSVFLICYLLITKKKFVFNRSVLLGAAFMSLEMNTYVIANKMTTAANTIVLQYTAPVFIILFMLIFFHEKPTRLDLITTAVVLGGIVCVLLDSLGGGRIAGDLVAILSGVFYAGVFMLDTFPGGDPLSSVILGHSISALIGLPFLCTETDFSGSVMILALALGVFQVGCAYIFFTEGIKRTKPVAASLIAGIEPILNPILAAIFASQTMSPLAIVGAVIVIGSVAVYNVLKAKAEEKTEKEPS